MRIINGKKIAEKILSDLKLRLNKVSFQPVFCDILVGEDPASAQYIFIKAKTAEALGMKFRRADFSANITTEALIKAIKNIAAEPNMCGLIVQLPLPEHLDKAAILNAVDPEIDADCTGKINSEAFYSGKSFLQFPTAAAILEILESLNMDFSGKKFFVLGHGQLVGRPVEYLLKQKGYNVESADKNNFDLASLISRADVVISALGRPKFITGGMLKPGCIVIDAGTSEFQGGIVGDVDFESVSKIAALVSPVPGGVGPVTVAKLLQNVLAVAERKAKLKA